MADGSELPVGEYRIMPTEEPRKYVMAVKLSTKVINHLQKGTHRAASICFGKENKFIVDNEQYTFTVQQEDKMVQDCYYQSSDLLAEIGGVKKKLLFTQELTGEDRSRIKESSRQAEEKFRNHKSIVLPSEGKTKKGTKTTKVAKRTVTTTIPKPSRLVVPTPQARTPPQPSTPPLPTGRPQPRPSTPPLPPTAAVPSPQMTQAQTPPTTSLSPPQSTPPQGPLLSPPQSQQQQKVLSPPLANPTTPTTSTPPLSSKPRSAGRSRSAITQPTPTPLPKETANVPPPKFPLRTHLIHDIALQPRTVAKLAEKHNVPHSEITQLLPGFAKYTHPPGLWYPKNEMFQEVDPEWHEYPPEDREVVREKKNEALIALAAAPPAPVEDKTLAAATKNLKDIIPIDPSERRKRPRIDRPPSSTSSTSTPTAPSTASSTTASVLTPPLPASTSNELSPTLDLSPPLADPSSVKKRTRESSSSSLPSKIAKPSPSPELLSPPLTSSSSSSSSTPASAPPSATTSKRKPPHSSLKPPATSPIPTPTSAPFVTPMPKSKPKTAPSPIPPPTKSTPPTKPPSKPSSTPPADKVQTTPTPPKPSKSTSKSAATKPPSSSSSSSSTPRPSSASVKLAAKPPSSKPTSRSSSSSSKNIESELPALKPVPPPPKFSIVINNNQDNEKYRKTYSEKYVIYRDLHRKLTENRDLFVEFDKKWRTSDQAGREALSVEIETAYKERHADVEKVQADHSVLHAELLAIKDAMKRYVDSARTRGGRANDNNNNNNNNNNQSRTNSQSKPPNKQPLPSQSQKPSQKRPSPPPSGLQSPPLKLQQTSQQQKITPPKASTSSTTTTTQPSVQSPQKPKPQPKRQTPPPTTQKQKPVATKS